MTTPEWGFIEPLGSLAELDGDQVAETLGLPNRVHKSDFQGFRGLSTMFDDIAARAASYPGRYEDQCSPKYYVDLYECVQIAAADIKRIVEVGVYMGGASVILAGCAAQMDLTLDLVDTNRSYLRFTHERIRRAFPDDVHRVRMFFGDLPTYVRDVLLKEAAVKFMVQHDGAHDFNQVVRDLSALYFAREQLHTLTIQDTHLRGTPPYFNFVDAAVYSIFGFDLSFVPMGTTWSAADTLMTTPNQYQGNYFLAGKPEGMYLPMRANAFFFPHPSHSIDLFLPIKK